MDVRPSRRLGWAWLGWCALLAVSISWTSVPLMARLGAMGAVFAVFRAGRRYLALTDRQAVRRLYWGSDGRWQLQDAALRNHNVRLAAPALLTGPLLWLRLRSVNQRYTVLIDERYTEPAAFCALKGRLKLNPYRRESGH